MPTLTTAKTLDEIEMYRFLMHKSTSRAEWRVYVDREADSATCARLNAATEAKQVDFFAKFPALPADFFTLVWNATDQKRVVKYAESAYYRDYYNTFADELEDFLPMAVPMAERTFIWCAYFVTTRHFPDPAAGSSLKEFFAALGFARNPNRTPRQVRVELPGYTLDDKIVERVFRVVYPGMQWAEQEPDEDDFFERATFKEYANRLTRENNQVARYAKLQHLLA